MATDTITVARRPNVAHGQHSPTTVEALLRELIELQRENNAKQDQILAALQRRRPAALSLKDLELLAKLLPPIGATLGSEGKEFAVWELFEDKAPGLRLVMRGLKPRHVGRLFRRAEGHAVDGYVIERTGVVRHATQWRVLQTAEFSKLPVSPATRDAGEQ